MKNTLKSIIGVAAIALATVISTGCSTQSKHTDQCAFTTVPIVSTGTGVVLYPSDYVSVTNGAGQVTIYAKYSAITTSNPPPFSFAGLFAGYDNSLTAFRDKATESHSGSGRGFLVDSKYSQLTSEFTSGSRFSGNSSLSVGAIELTVNTNAITATGNAGNQVLQGIGAAAGDIISNAKK